jgi:recombination protein RecR
MKYPEPITRLIESFRRLPGVGPRSAARMTWHMLNGSYDDAVEMARAVVGVHKNITRCATCGNFTDTAHDPCPICANPARDASIVCAVESSEDVLALERAGGFNGLYHVLGGTINPASGKGPDSIRAAQLVQRAKQGAIEEIIIATNPSLEGEATALYLAEILQPLAIRITRPAHGIPMGADLEFLDGDTIARAMSARRGMESNNKK